MENKCQLLANKWKNQADKSSNEQEQTWLYACAADLKSLIDQQSKVAMPLIGPLLEEWDALPGDVKGDPELARFAVKIDGLMMAMDPDGDDKI